jgi:Uma2 family endonuclease
MTSPPGPSPSPPRVIPVGPTIEEWRAMAPAEREKFLVKVLDALTDPQSTMSEGRPHKKAKTRTLDLLGLHFKAMGRVVYLAEEMAVVYPGEVSFSPDVLAVLDVPQPEDDERLAWVVADEGKGLDFVLEVLHHGDRNKDLVENVERYAHLGIPEYFVCDLARQKIHGYRLPGDDTGVRRYQRIVPQAGRFSSAVLGLDLAIQGGTLRFFQGMAELFGSADLIGRLTGIVEELEAKADEAEAKVHEAAVKADEAEAKAEQAVTGLRAGVLAALDTRGIVCPNDARARVRSCGDPATLQRWLLRAMTAGALEEVFAE